MSTLSECNISLAPFQGVTGVVFRKVFTKYFSGVDSLYTPFFTGVLHRLTAKQLAELGENKVNGIRVVPQLLSKDADEIIRFSEVCAVAGFGEINWNLGCPFPQVANKKRGSGLMPHPEMVQDILEKAMPALPTRLSVKCRIGYTSPEEIAAMMPVFNRFQLSELIIHPRLGRQLYTGKPDWDAFARAARMSALPVAYNGDITSADEFMKMKTQFPAVNSWMIGRGLLADPFLAADIKGMTVTGDRKQHIRKFADELYYAYRRQFEGRLSALGMLKEYWHYLSGSFSDPHHVFRLIRRTKDFDEYETAVNIVFEEFDWVHYP